MAKPFIKKLSVVPLEGDVDHTPEELEVTWEIREPLDPRVIRKFPKFLKRLGKVLIVIVSTFIIIYGPIFMKNHVNIKILDGGSKNTPLILDWLVWLMVMAIGLALFALSILIVYVIFKDLIKPIVKWIME